MFTRMYVRAHVWTVGLFERITSERGATAVEYALLLAFIFMVIFGAVAFMGKQTNSQFQKVQFP